MMLRGFANEMEKGRATPAKLVHVLLVEDDDVDVMAVKRAFKASKIDNPLWVARDGIEALAMLRGEGVPTVPRPYLILLDLNMPRMNGIEFLQELRDDPDHGRAVVFILTTSAVEEDRIAAYKEMVAGYIVKANAGHDFLRVVKLLEAYWTIVEGNDELRNVNNALRLTNEQVTVESLETTRLNEHLTSVLNTVGECLIVLGRDLRVRFANRAFHRTFGTTPQEIEGLYLHEFGNEWSARGLTDWLHGLDESASLEDLYLEQEVPGAGFRSFVLNARRIEQTSSILLALEDVTERRESEKKLHDYQQELQQMAFAAAVAGERERRRIAIDLHDRIGQSLALAQIKLQTLGDTVAGASRAMIDEAVQLLAQSIVDTRTLTFELSPPVLYDLGLKAALGWLVDDIEKRYGMRVDLHDDGSPKALDDVTASLVFRAVRELLMNVLKHAKAMETKVALRRIDDQLEIDVEDKGVGFNPDEVSSRSTDNGFGLFSVREQISRLGGTVDVVSMPQRGTRVRVRVPLKTEARSEETEESS